MQTVIQVGWSHSLGFSQPLRSLWIKTSYEGCKTNVENGRSHGCAIGNTISRTFRVSTGWLDHVAVDLLPQVVVKHPPFTLQEITFVGLGWRYLDEIATATRTKRQHRCIVQSMQSRSAFSSCLAIVYSTIWFMIWNAMKWYEMKRDSIYRIW